MQNGIIYTSDAPSIFERAGVRPGARLNVRFGDAGGYPRSFTGTVEEVYPMWALVMTDAGYYTTIHFSHLVSRGCVSIRVLSGYSDNQRKQVMGTSGFAREGALA